MFLTLMERARTTVIAIREPIKAAATIPREVISIPAFKRKIMVMATKSLAPEEMPRTKGPAIGLPKKVWSKKPETDRAPPRRIAARILGSLIPVRIFFSTRFSPEPENIFISSLNERSTLPVNTFHRKIKRRRIKIRQKKNPYRLFILIFQCR